MSKRENYGIAVAIFLALFFLLAWMFGGGTSPEEQRVRDAERRVRQIEAEIEGEMLMEQHRQERERGRR